MTASHSLDKQLVGFIKQLIGSNELMKPTLNISGYGDAVPGWEWIVPFWNDLSTKWAYYSTNRSRWLATIPGPHWGRVRAGLRMNVASRLRHPDLIVSIGPVNATYVEAIGQAGRRRSSHLAWAFNFTGLPHGRQRAAMSRALRTVERFVVFSRMERTLYADHFDLPEDRFHFTHWGVTPPLIAAGPRVVAGPYVASLGGEARDYATLCDAARQMPHVRFVLIARPHSLEGHVLPPNIDVRVNLPWHEAWSLVAHADLAVIPLLGSETPNGHVTLVGGMQLGKAQVVTASRGVADYIDDRDTALTVPPCDATAMARAIAELLDDRVLRDDLAARARAFADIHCSEQATIDFARRQVREMLGV